MQENRDACGNSLAKFQDLLRILFQFDCVDLDFGIYRILNYKRDQLEAFITERLPQTVGEAFAGYAAATSEGVAKEAEEVKQQIVTDWGPESFDGTGQLKSEIRDKPIGKKYTALQERVKLSKVPEELETRIYNDLHTFFSRYYEDGDFIAKRRYGRTETYSVPYNGEEVVLYWANRDQYYVKTGERIKAYRFRAGEYSVSFELQNVPTEQNSNGGKKRYFVLAQDKCVTWSEQGKTLRIVFEYRHLTEAEEKEHGRTEQQKPQESLNEAAHQEILRSVDDGGLKVAFVAPEGTNRWTLLRRHLTRFTRKNTTDFFIHKDLRGFLRRELDFFIKSQVLLLDELTGGNEEDLREHIQRGRAVREVAEAIIDFLAQVEDYLKRLWEKRKFVLRTEYCLTIDRVSEELWGELLANPAQAVEWRQLYSLEGKVDEGFLKAHPALMVDTRHFPEDFKWRLLASLDDLDEELDGLLIKSENWQALNLLVEKYRDTMACIYNDPPYNSPSTEIIYKNNYKHSTWMTFMFDRLHIAKETLEDRGAIAIAIDDHEYTNLRGILLEVFAGELQTVVVRSNPAGRSTPRGFSLQHEYTVFTSSNDDDRMVGHLQHSERQKQRYKDRDTRGAFEWVNFRKHGGLREESPRMYYPIFIDRSRLTWRIPEMDWNEATSEWVMVEQPTPDEDVSWPVDESQQQRRWKWAVERLDSDRNDVKVARDRNGLLSLYIKARIPIEGRTPPTWWDKKEYSATDSGTRTLKDLFGRLGVFDYPKAVALVQDCLRVAALDKNGHVLDNFAGSGTTAHAVIDMNRHDSGKRRYVLVEIGDWFETVILPRIKKVVFCEKWKDGTPQGGTGVSQLVKYQYLEQYEDTLNNLDLPRASDGQEMMRFFGDEYLLRYMLDFETQGSPSLMNLEMFKDPFAYRLRVQEGDQLVERSVDLVETFNYLLGLKVRKVRVFQDNGCPYRAVMGEKYGKRVVVVWRPVAMPESSNESLMRDKEFIEKTVLPALLGETVPDRLLVNGACFVKGAETIEAEFRRLMFPPVSV